MTQQYTRTRKSFGRSASSGMACWILLSAIRIYSSSGTDEGESSKPWLYLKLTSHCLLPRICPGRHFADDLLYITIATVLHVFDIRPPLDEGGQPIHIKYEQTDALVT